MPTSGVSCMRYRQRVARRIAEMDKYTRQGDNRLASFERAPCSAVFSAALQVRQHPNAAVDVLRGYSDDFLADAMKFQIDVHVAYGQIADAQRLDADG